MYKCSAVAEMGDRLATIDMSQKEGAGLLCTFRGGIRVRAVVWESHEGQTDTQTAIHFASATPYAVEDI